MLELARDLLPLLRAGETVATVTVARVARSAPRGTGSAMAVTRDARVIGSISGGCVEADAVALALASLGSGAGSASRFGFSDEQAFAAGLACGGTIDAVITVLRPDDHLAIEQLERAAADLPAELGIVTRGPRTGVIVRADAVEPGGEGVLIVRARPKPRLILLGAGEHAAALSRIGSASGFAVTVCDVWPLLVTPERFPDAVERVAELPHEYLEAQRDLDERSAICVLTHDVRLDIPALRVALASPAGFVGALGARSTVARRRELLLDEGVTEAQLARLRSPLGLDLGGASPEETALAALAEIVAARHGGTGLPLSELRGPLHARAAADERMLAAEGPAGAPASARADADADAEAAAAATATIAPASCAVPAR